MGRVLITGMSGVGKSSVVDALLGRGVFAVDTDYGPWKDDDGLWHVDAVRDLVTAHQDIVVSGTVENQGLLYDAFDHVVLLTAPPTVLIDRVKMRSTNPYGSSQAERDEILENARTVEPLLRATATLTIDTTQPLSDTVDRIAQLLTTPPRFT